MVIAVASGKGGTGKTTVAVNLFLACASLKSEKNLSQPRIVELQKSTVTFLDCDVEEPNAHIFLEPEIDQRIPVFTMIARVLQERCSGCGTCAQVCSFNAILVGRHTAVILENLCHGCTACALFCPRKAIVMSEKEVGRIETGTLGPDLFFAHGILNTGETLTTKVIGELKRTVRQAGIVIIDAPPGASCPMVSAVKGSDYCILVTEPTPFGLHDLGVAVEVMEKLRIPVGVVINRADTGDPGVLRFCRERGLPVLMEIPFDRELMEEYASGRAATRYSARYLALYQNLALKVLAGPAWSDSTT